MKPAEFLIDGCKGAGKGTVIGMLLKNFSEIGLVAHTFSPFNGARALHKRDTGEDDFAHLWSVSPQTRGRAEKLLRDAIADGRLEAEKQKSDLILFDRGWITTLTALKDAAFENEDEKRRVENEWAPDMLAFFLNIPPEITIKRRGSLFYGKPQTPEMEAKIRRDHEVRTQVCAAYRNSILRIFDTSDAPSAFTEAAEEVQKVILTTVQSKISKQA